MPPPTSKLFPYTTLFRSISVGKSPPFCYIRQPVQGGSSVSRMSKHGHHHPLCRLGPRQGLRHGADGADRKSTRLNSSHVEISYAVFCLKKKNRTQRRKLD